MKQQRLFQQHEDLPLFTVPDAPAPPPAFTTRHELARMTNTELAEFGNSLAQYLDTEHEQQARLLNHLYMDEWYARQPWTNRP